jgi:glutamate-1-semialdehyde 2,1-aminomutase
MWGFHFTEGPVRNFADARRADVALFRRFFWACLRRGVNLAPSAFEAAFVSVAHGDAEIERTVAVFGEAMEEATA